MKLGIDRLLEEHKLQKPLLKKRISVLAHPASVTKQGLHTVDALMIRKKFNLQSAFGPQHGMRGDKQDNMIESEDFLDPRWKIPVFSLYGKVRRPTVEMMNTFDVILVDLQDVGTRIYTFITTLLYILEESAKQGKTVWVLDRPNPAGRAIEGSILKPGWESFVGAGPLIMRHGLTIGEIAQWFVKTKNLNVDLNVITMKNYRSNSSPDFGWPSKDLTWVNPSPNIPSFHTTRVYPGSVLIEGTHLSEGRGTTRPFEIFGAPDIDVCKILSCMQKLAPQWLKGCMLRPCYFEPTFQKHAGHLCQGLQIHVDSPFYQPKLFKPYRLIALFLKALRSIHPEYEIWHTNPYEYEEDRLAIDLLSGGEEFRKWVDDPEATPRDLDCFLVQDEKKWSHISKSFHLY